MCPPVPDQDIKCTPCSQAHCCDEEAACHLDLDCACIYDCLAVDGQGLAFCAVTCMVANPADNPKIATVRDCRHANCESLCFP